MPKHTWNPDPTEVEEVEDEFDFYGEEPGLTDITHWLTLTSFTVEEVVALSLARNPDVVHGERLPPLPNSFTELFQNRVIILERALADGTLVSLKAADVVDFLERKRIIPLVDEEIKISSPAEVAASLEKEKKRIRPAKISSEALANQLFASFKGSVAIKPATSTGDTKRLQSVREIMLGLAIIFLDFDGKPESCRKAAKKIATFVDLDVGTIQEHLKKAILNANDVTRKMIDDAKPDLLSELDLRQKGG